jgi:hypothetical protein
VSTDDSSAKFILAEFFEISDRDVDRTRPRFCEERKLTTHGFRGRIRGMEKERISQEAGSEQAWICMCGNTPLDAGFDACDKEGNHMEPHEKWIDPLYVCDRCGRIIHQQTLEVVGRKAVPSKAAI